MSAPDILPPASDTRRRIQNRIAQRQHRDRIRNEQGPGPSNKKGSSTLVWTQPLGIPRPPAKCRKEAPRQHAPPSLPSTVAPPTPRSPATTQRDVHIVASEQPALGEGFIEMPPDLPSDLGLFSHTLSADDGDTCQMLDMQYIMSSPKGAASESGRESLPSFESLAASTLHGSMSSDHLVASTGDAPEDSSVTDQFSGFNALQLAAHHGQASIVRLLSAAHPASVNTLTSGGQSSLHIAAAANHTDAVHELLNVGADAALQDEQGRTALHVAISAGAYAVACTIVSRRKDLLDVRDSCGRTVLHEAVVQGDEAAVRFLLEQGADPAVVI